jgi:hypothetical protein
LQIVLSSALMFYPWRVLQNLLVDLQLKVVAKIQIYANTTTTTHHNHLYRLLQRGRSRFIESEFGTTQYDPGISYIRPKRYSYILLLSEVITYRCQIAIIVKSKILAFCKTRCMRW